jgi:glucokinase
MSDLILALDFGGTKLTAATVRLESVKVGNPVWHDMRRVFSPPGADAQYDISTMMTLGQELLAGTEAAAIGVSFGGPVAYATGTVRLSHHVAGWENIPLGKILEEEFGAPAQVDNDANLAALGEHRFGAGRGYENLMYITVSTGVGGGWVLDGRLWWGHQGMAGEIGHTVVDPDGPICLCGKRGCVERLASGPYLAQEFRQAREKEMTLLPGDEITGKTVAEAATAGDAAARKILARGAWALGVGIGNAANLVNPQLFVLGGGVTKGGELWWSGVRQAARETALPEVQFDIVPAGLNDDAPLWGAVALALTAFSPSAYD